MGPAGANINYGMGANYWLLNSCWTVGCGNNSPTEYSASNAELDGSGDLAITATQGGSGMCGDVACAYTSAGFEMIDWANDGIPTWSQEYGTFTARIKMPAGQGLWPAFFLGGANNAQVGFPEDGEIDVVEADGSNLSYTSGHAIGGLTPTPTAPGLNWGQDNLIPGGGSITGWHTYSITWSPYGIQWQVDGQTTQAMSAAVANAIWGPAFEHPFCMYLDLTVGGGAWGLPDASTVFPATMLVNYVEVTSGN
jgi:beta-glucanase (GH16 family)